VSRSVRMTIIIVCLGALALLILLPRPHDNGRLGEAPSPGRPATAGCSPRWGRAVDIGRLPGNRKEVSGFVSSSAYPRVAWMVRDSGNPPVLYSFEVVGGAVRSGEFPVIGATNGDWEDVAYTRGDDGRGRIWILDNINRHTDAKIIYEVLEPDPAADRTARMLGRYRWRYPDGNGDHDTEVLLALGGQLVVVSKSTPSRAYRFEAPLDREQVNEPVLVATVTEGERMTLGSTTSDERWLLLSSTKDDVAWVYHVGDPSAGLTGFLSHPPVLAQVLSPSQREAGDFYPFDGCDIVLLSERENIWLLRNL
jgi:hypothetical protein